MTDIDPRHADYDRAYAEHPDFFGAEMAPLLADWRKRLTPGGRVLDLGVGQGRNALPLARDGFRVTGIDTSGVAIATVRERAAAENIPFDLWQGSFLDFEPAGGEFDAVLCLGLLQVLPRSEGAGLFHRLRKWTRPGGLLLMVAWQVDDPAYKRIAETWERIGLHSYRSPAGDLRTFLERREILGLLKGWEIVHHWEGLGPVHSHAGGEPEQHGHVEVVAVRQ